MVKAKDKRAKPAGEAGAAKPKSNGAVFILAALDMSWRLAIAVLVPIIGGYELDKHLGISPALTIAGFIIAMVGVYAVMKQTVANADSKINAGRAR